MNKNEIKLKRDEILQYYINGTPVEELMKMYNTSWSNIYNIVSVTLRKTIKDVTKFEEKKIISLYKNEKWSCAKIGLEVNLYHKNVAEILEMNGINRTYSARRKHTLNEHYFDKIDTPNKAYILGLFYADGYNSLDKSTVRLQLQYSDVDILEKSEKNLAIQSHLNF